MKALRAGKNYIFLADVSFFMPSFFASLLMPFFFMLAESLCMAAESAADGAGAGAGAGAGGGGGAGTEVVSDDGVIGAMVVSGFGISVVSVFLVQAEKRRPVLTSAVRMSARVFIGKK